MWSRATTGEDLDAAYREYSRLQRAAVASRPHRLTFAGDAGTV